MGVPGNANALLLRSAAAAGGYQISRSLRFNSSDSAYLSRTPSSAGNRRTWTWAAWVKRSAFQSGTSNTYMQLFSAGTGATSRDVLFFDTDTDDTLAFYSANGIAGTATLMFRTNAVFRDASAWMHIILAVDTTQATAANRVKLYVNGVEQTFSTVSYPSQNAEGYINLNNAHYIATHPPLGEYFSGYVADAIFIDGQQLTPSALVETSATTGQLIPKAYTGSYGTNGFRLTFSDNSGTTSTTLGKDSAGSNNWTPNNFSVAAGAGNDSLVDTPTSYGTDTGAGGGVRGNYATLNPLDKGANISVTDGNLTASVTSTGGIVLSTFGVSSGKWYWEMERNGGTDCVIGIAKASASKTAYLGSDANGWGYIGGSGNKVNNASSVAYGTAYASGVVVGVALDMDAGTVTFYRNGTSQGTAYSGLTGTIFPAFGTGNNTDSVFANFGQRPFAYTAPSGFKALCDTNLPAPVVAKPSEVMDILLWSGNNASPRSLSGLNFSPDFAWLKVRSDAAGHSLFDTVRGVGKSLETNITGAEVTNSQFGYISTFDSSGFTVTAGTYPGFESGSVNMTGRTYVGWCWDAGSSTVSNTQGSITSSCRTNLSSGFSIITFNTQASGTATVGHGLGVAPEMFIIKARTVVNQWWVYHKSLPTPQSNAIALNLTNAALGSTTLWNNTAPTSSVLHFDSGWAGNNPVVVYAWAPVAGYSSFGSYTSNNSADGPFIYTGFKIRFLLVKQSGGSGNPWLIFDSARSTYNVVGNKLAPNSSVAEDDASIGNSTQNTVDFLSNGFKFRTANTGTNGPADTYIYCAWAESPFQYARAR